jgi:hypothetical protein
MESGDGEQDQTEGNGMKAVKSMKGIVVTIDRLGGTM